MTFAEWINAVASSPLLIAVTALTVGVIFVNGWTDAPNAIASSVATGVLSPARAVTLAAACNFIGLVLSVRLCSTVTDTVLSMVDFGHRREVARIALCAGMLAVVVWAVAAWFFGIPTSESHALIAGITGAALAVNGGEGIRFSVWKRVLWGLPLSVGIGFLLGYFAVRGILLLFRDCERRRAQRILGSLQTLFAGVNAALHGAQDGQKFIGVLLLSVASGTVAAVPPWSVLLCCGVLCIGTCFGGGRIIRSVGMKMVRMERHQGVAADVATAVSLLVCTLFGLPVSTTHVKTTAIMGAGASKRLRGVNWSVALQMIVAWIVTFPGCGILGYLTAKIFFLLLHI